jgi:uncharacterized protein with PIN domain
MEEQLKRGMAAWRKEHPKATLREIEAELDQRVAVIRAALLEETVAASAAVTGAAGTGAAGMKCPVCDGPLAADGKRRRRLTTTGGQELELEREYMRCARCGHGFFPPG